MSQVGLPEPTAVWFGYLIPELLLPIVITVAQFVANRRASQAVATA